jgi:hypothetical protein
MDRKLVEGIAPTSRGTIKVINQDYWTKTLPKANQHEGVYQVPKGEPPICCPDTRKNPTVSKPVFPSGTLQCPPEEGGCGSTWTKKEK